MVATEDYSDSLPPLAACDERLRLPDRVVSGDCSPETPTDPYVRDYRIRFLWLPLRYAIDGMSDGWSRQGISCQEALEPGPWRAIPVPTAQPLEPGADRSLFKASQRGTVASDSVVLVMTTEFLTQSRVLRGKWEVAVTPTPDPDCVQTPAQAA